MRCRQCSTRRIRPIMDLNPGVVSQLPYRNSRKNLSRPQDPPRLSNQPRPTQPRQFRCRRRSRSTLHRPAPARPATALPQPARTPLGDGQASQQDFSIPRRGEVRWGRCLYTADAAERPGGGPSTGTSPPRSTPAAAFGVLEIRSS